MNIFITGFFTALGLIFAIGAQNAFVLRQGLRGQHVLAVCLTCAISDAILITAGVAGAGVLTMRLPWLDPLMRIAGAIFLVWYGARSLRAALSSGDALIVTANDGSAQSLSTVLVTCLALTWLNPHVWLDTVVLLGAISTQFPGLEISFTAGAITASSTFFMALGYGAAWLRPLFARPSAWRLLELVVAIVMWAIALKLLWPWIVG